MVLKRIFKIVSVVLLSAFALAVTFLERLWLFDYMNPSDSFFIGTVIGGLLLVLAVVIFSWRTKNKS